MVNNLCATTVFYDFTKVFDCVSYTSFLIKKFESYGIRGISLNWFELFYLDQAVKVNNTVSSCEKIRFDVPRVFLDKNN